MPDKSTYRDAICGVKSGKVHLPQRVVPRDYDGKDVLKHRNPRRSDTTRSLPSARTAPSPALKASSRKMTRRPHSRRDSIATQWLLRASRARAPRASWLRAIPDAARPRRWRSGRRLSDGGQLPPQRVRCWSARRVRGVPERHWLRPLRRHRDMNAGFARRHFGEGLRHELLLLSAMRRMPKVPDAIVPICLSRGPLFNRQLVLLMLRSFLHVQPRSRSRLLRAGPRSAACAREGCRGHAPSPRPARAPSREILRPRPLSRSE
ncbi:hypothetical protein AWB68_08828 [Caballeronia choica]|uniref:Uncharacterized protein n=1 Tax=Caballeronia choica TaxID=326476 RepID=A0A158L6J6_9BURK|nr:hypothetical protein AWB68_08828 [Caballeronia choica]